MRMKCALSLCAVWLALSSLPGCSRWRAAAGGRAARHFRVANAQDLLRLRSEYLRLYQQGFDGVLDVEVAAGKYESVGWDLEPPQATAAKNIAPRMDIVLRGAPAVLPLPSGIAARSLRLENLVIAKMSSITPTNLEVTKDLVIERCLVVGNAWSSAMSPGPFIQVRARSDSRIFKSPVDVTIEDSWFVGNRSDPAVPLLGFVSSPLAPGHFDHLTIRRSVFAGGSFAPELEVEHARRMIIENALFYERDAGVSILSCRSSADIAIRGSILVVEDVARLVQLRQCPPPRFEASRIYARAWKPGMTAPEALKIAPADIRGHDVLAAAEPILAEIAGVSAENMPTAGLRERLAKACGVGSSP